MYSKPTPTINDRNRQFWAALRERRLELQRCGQCGELRYPISRYCPDCLADDFTWEAVSGRGTVFSYIVFHQVYHRAFADDVPYNVALVQLAEGPRMFSNIVNVENGEVKVGDAVVVSFDDVTPDLTLPRFEPAR